MCDCKNCQDETPMAKEYMAKAWKDTKASYERMVKATSIEASDFDGLSPDMKLLWLYQTMLAGVFTEHHSKLEWLKGKALGVEGTLRDSLGMLGEVKRLILEDSPFKSPMPKGPRPGAN